MKLVCIECGAERTKGRRYCRKCHLKRARERAKERYEKFGRYMYNNVCCACGTTYRVCYKQSRLCKDCRCKITSRTNGGSPYTYLKCENGVSVWEHRDVAERILGRSLKKHENVHHIDEDPKNNVPTNLIVLSRGKHCSLHHFLQEERIIYEAKACDFLVVISAITFNWLRTANVKFIYLGD